MSQQQEFQSLARHFMELWQERVSALMQDDEYVRLLMKLLQAAPGAGASGANTEDFYAAFLRKAQTGGAPPAPDAGAAALARVERSLAAIERRLAALESVNVRTARRAQGRAGGAMAKNAGRAGTGKSRRKRSKK